MMNDKFSSKRGCPERNETGFRRQHWEGGVLARNHPHADAEALQFPPGQGLHPHVRFQAQAQDVQELDDAL